MLLLKNIDIGACRKFELVVVDARFGFISSLSNIVVTPILHRISNTFQGSRSAVNYICFNSIKDQYLALSKNGEIECWNLLTCKFEGK